MRGRIVILGGGTGGGPLTALRLRRADPDDPDDAAGRSPVDDLAAGGPMVNA